MAIVLILLGILGWIIDANNLLVIPHVIYQGLIVAGVAGIIIQLLVTFAGFIKINKKFK